VRFITVMLNYTKHDIIYTISIELEGNVKEQPFVRILWKIVKTFIASNKIIRSQHQQNAVHQFVHSSFIEVKVIP